jgi:hypothetical protein
MATDIGIRVALNLPYEQAVEKTTGALKAEGFGVLTQIDMQATLKQKINADFRRYVILGACNPSLSHRASWPTWTWACCSPAMSRCMKTVMIRWSPPWTPWKCSAASKQTRWRMR